FAIAISMQKQMHPRNHVRPVFGFLLPGLHPPRRVETRGGPSPLNGSCRARPPPFRTPSALVTSRCRPCLHYLTRIARYLALRGDAVAPRAHSSSSRPRKDTPPPGHEPLGSPLAAFRRSKKSRRNGKKEAHTYGLREGHRPRFTRGRRLCAY